MDMEKVAEKKEDVPGPKSSEPDWEMADTVPVTEAELVGDLLKDQEEDDRAQFVEGVGTPGGEVSVG